MAELNQYDQIYEDEGIIELPMPDWKITNRQQIVGKVIVNIGGGTAKDIWHLAAANSCYCVDASQIALQVAERHRVKAVLVDLESNNIPLPKDFADIVVCKDVLEHVLHPEVLLGEIHRVLRPDGYVVINVPNHFCLNQRVKFMLGKGLMWDSLFHRHWKIFKAWNYMHLRFFTYRDFLELLQTESFVPVKHFFDLGSFNHYLDPEQAIPHFRAHLARLEPRLTRKEQVVKYGVLPMLRLIDFVFPRRIREKLCALRPSLLSGCFYVWCKKGVR